ncbi:MAG TPA: penicillin-binding protein 2 [Thermoleophilaceae bacterium]|nr:penicillin-binding protein 2 [Thermoleophilaceae bacterium]
MNRQIVQLFTLVVVLFGLLVAFTSRWTVFEAESLEENTANRRPLLEDLRVPRGQILARDGTLIARSDPVGEGERQIYVRSYPEAGLFAHPIGYSFQDQRSGLERSRNDELTGEENEFVSLFEELVGHEREGDDVHTTLDAEAQSIALEGLGTQSGAVVALEPSTGRVRAMVSTPTFDPNQIEERSSELNQDPAAPILNRATQSRYPPGSTMKVVTAVAALDSGEYEPDSIVSGESPKVIGGAPLSNCCAEGSGDYGPLSLTEALTNSVNTVWAEVGEELGAETMLDYMERFGFGSDPPLDYPDDQMVESGVVKKGGDLADEDDGFDVGRVAIGQGGEEGQTQATALQMAMVAAAVGNDGVLMKPRLTDRVVDKDGRVRERIEPSEEGRVMSTETAEEVQAMMLSVVQSGTGTTAQISGVEVAGKTGTAERGDGTNNAWFITFAPADDPQIAIATVVEETTGQGGSVAAPIAKSVMEALLG